MPRKKKSFTYRGVEYPGIYEEIVRKNGNVDHIRYYFKNDKDNKIRAKEKEDIVRIFTDFHLQQDEAVIPLYTENNNTPEKTARFKELGVSLESPLKVNKDVPLLQEDKVIRVDELYEIPKRWLLMQFRKMLEDDPQQLAEDLGVREIAYLPKLKPKIRLMLRQVGIYYFDREKYTPKRALSAQHRREAKQYWREFSSITGVKYVDEIGKEALNQYNRELTKVANDPTYRPRWLSRLQRERMKGRKLTIRWIKTRLDMTKTILNNAIKVAECSDDIEDALKLCRKTFYHEDIPKAIVRQIFEKEHVAALLELLDQPRNNRERRAYVKWKAMILLALNCAFTPIDLADLTVGDMDWESKELAMIRKKKNTERYAVLWDRTVVAIEEYMKIRPIPKADADKHVFINKDGCAIKHDHLGDDFRAFIKKVNSLKGDVIPEGLTFKFFRKSAASSAERTPGANPSEVSYLLGHSAGIRKHYTLRAADLVGNVCSKIERDYFG